MQMSKLEEVIQSLQHSLNIAREMGKSAVRVKVGEAESILSFLAYYKKRVDEDLDMCMRRIRCLENEIYQTEILERMKTYDENVL